MKTALTLNMAGNSLPAGLKNEAPTSEDIKEEMEARGPMLRWAITRWMIEAAGIEKPGVWCPALKRMELHPWQWTPKGHPSLTTPTLIQSLRALRPQLTLEIKKGFKTSPFRVCRLAYRTAIVYVLAALSWLPGPQRKLIQRTWPRLVEHLASTLEQNHLRVLQLPKTYRSSAESGTPGTAPIKSDKAETITSDGPGVLRVLSGLLDAPRGWWSRWTAPREPQRIDWSRYEDLYGPRPT